MKTDDYICGCHYGALQNAVQFLNLASSCGILLNAASLERSVLRPAGAALRRNKIGCFAGCVAGEAANGAVSPRWLNWLRRIVELFRIFQQNFATFVIFELFSLNFVQSLMKCCPFSDLFRIVAVFRRKKKGKNRELRGVKGS